MGNSTSHKTRKNRVPPRIMNRQPVVEHPVFYKTDGDGFAGHGPEMERETALLIFQLENDRLYTVTQAVETRFPKGHSHRKRLIDRLNWFVHYTRLTREVDAVQSGRRMWFGATLKNSMTPKSFYRAQILSTLPGLLQLVVREKSLTEKQTVSSSPVPNPVRKPIAASRRFTPSFFKPPLLRRGYLRKILIVALTGIFFTAATMTVLTDPSRILEILKTHGPKAAAMYTVSSKSQGAQAYFLSAWMDFRTNHFKSAEHKAFELLKDSDLPDSIRGDCFYLLGFLRSVTGHFDNAYLYLNDARHYYEKEKRYRALYSTAIAMAKYSLYLGEVDRAESLLSQALEFNRVSGGRCDMGAYHALAGRVSVKKGDLHAALEHGLKRYELLDASNDIDTKSGAYSELGYLYLLNGDLARGQDFTLRAQSLIFQTADERRNVYNLINFVVLAKIQGMEAPHAVETIRTWIDAYQDRELQIFLDDALNAPFPGY